MKFQLTKDNLKKYGPVIIFIFIGVICFFKESSGEGRASRESELDAHEAVASADTFIPAGYVLVPIELANANSLNSLIGPMGGVVDLYLASTETQKGGTKVGSRLKILKAPLNPEQFAVLVRDQDSDQVLKYAGPFVAVIQNPDSAAGKLNNQTHSNIRIQYEQ